MEDKQIHERLQKLVDDEHELRESLGRGEITPDEEHARLREIEIALDQSWDLLRQRQALREAGADPEQAKQRSAGEVEGYLQ